MDLTALSDYLSTVIVGICLCVGYILKNIVPTDKVNRFIPLIMGALGLILNIWISGWSISTEVIMGGLFSGLASTGLHQAFKNLIDKSEEKSEEKTNEKDVE